MKQRCPQNFIKYWPLLKCCTVSILLLGCVCLTGCNQCEGLIGLKTLGLLFGNNCLSLCFCAYSHSAKPSNVKQQPCFSLTVSTSVKQNEVSSLSINLVIELSELATWHAHTTMLSALRSLDSIPLCCLAEELFFAFSFSSPGFLRALPLFRLRPGTLVGQLYDLPFNYSE